MSKEGIVRLLENWIKGQKYDIKKNAEFGKYGDAQYCLGKKDAYTNILAIIKKDLK